MRHLSRLAAFSYITNMHTKNLAIVWAPNLLRSKQIESACFSGTAAFMEVRIQSVVARTQAQINSPVTEDSKYIEVGEGPAALQGKFHTVIEFPTERKRPPIKSKKSPVGSWRSFFNLGKSSSMSKRKLQRNPSEPRESKVYRPRRPRSSSDALSASFNGELLDSRQHCDSYDNLDATEDSDGDDGPICVPALISPPRSAGEDVDLSPPDIGMASLDFDPMSFQCSVPDTTYAFPLDDSSTGAEGSTLKRSPSSFCGKSNSSDLLTPPFPDSMTSPLLSIEHSLAAAAERAEGKKLTTSYSYTDKPMQPVSPIKCGKATSLTPIATLELFSPEMSDKNGAGQPVSKQPLSPPLMPKDSPSLMGSMLLREAESSLSEAFQRELHSKLATFDTLDGKDLGVEDAVEQEPCASSQEHPGKEQRRTSRSAV
ncbi:hypothetical protein XENOCAPTIV_002616 [Xenoophorus captivus]|uniref:Rho-GAP domain-containing protein n=1 Tax=Xenoophorus captivus TaxID=1517983 RepID=A0ABV0RWK4_9TELE